MCKITAKIEIEIKTATFCQLQHEYTLAISHYQIARYHAKKLRYSNLAKELTKQIEKCELSAEIELTEETEYKIEDLKREKLRRKDKCRVKFIDVPKPI